MTTKVEEFKMLDDPNYAGPDRRRGGGRRLSLRRLSESGQGHAESEHGGDGRRYRDCPRGRYRFGARFSAGMCVPRAVDLGTTTPSWSDAKRRVL